MEVLEIINLGFFEFLFFCLIILFASFVRGFSGFGFSASSVSLLSFILPPKAHSSMLSKLSSLIATSKDQGVFKNQGRFAMPICRLVIEN